MLPSEATANHRKAKQLAQAFWDFVNQSVSNNQGEIAKMHIELALDATHKALIRQRKEAC